MKVIIDYDTVMFEFKIECNDSTIQNSLKQTIKDNQGKRITDWVKEFIKKVKEETNNDPFAMKIIGCDLYEEQYIKELFNEINIEFEKTVDDKDIQDKYKAIDNFLEYAEKSKEDIVKNALRPNIENIKTHRSTIIEIPVIATMSSGKSTLLNALIGKDYLPEDTGATTATTCDIIVNNHLHNFIGKAIFDGKEEKNTNGNISEFLKDWNLKANENINDTNDEKKYPDLKLQIEGFIPNLNTSNFNLHFIDTPGPNSSQHSHHKEKTFSYLKDNQNLPIVLYVLDPEKMDSKDDDFTLDEISKVFKNNNKSIDRIVFVYNKIDREDIEEKSIKEILNKVESFLERKGIKNAKIFPISAQYAKFAQIENNLTNKKKSDLRNYRDNFIHNIDDNYKGYQLLEYAPLTNSQREQLRKTITNGELDSELVYSGLAALKLYLEDYIINHHKKTQYKELKTIANKVYKQIETSIQLEEERLEEITEGQKKEKEENQKKDIAILDKKKEEAIEDINKIKVDKNFIEQKSREFTMSFNDIKNKTFQREELSKNEAIKLIEETNEVIKNMQISIKTDLISEMNNQLHKYLENIKKITKDKFSLDANNIEINAFNAEMENSVNAININQLHKYQEEKVETITREIESKWWIKRKLNWKVTEEHKVSKTIIKIVDLYRDTLEPYSKTFTITLEDYKQNFIEKFCNIHDSFINRIETEFENTKNNIFEKYTSSMSEDKIHKVMKLKELKKF
ncbi:dynamin family protein [Chryseobacterium sp. RR2-3-20]|uniref:dynamin family protein n=1 Tax=Chryseobacterium sp. RR2-3-20 TaxID=2787626 RepID=UPI001ADF3889|nr:dynamin family protein [Chryseobacterium sp. RR2-3-20]